MLELTPHKPFALHYHHRFLLLQRLTQLKKLLFHNNFPYDLKTNNTTRNASQARDKPLMNFTILDYKMTSDEKYYCALSVPFITSNSSSKMADLFFSACTTNYLYSGSAGHEAAYILARTYSSTTMTARLGGLLQLFAQSQRVLSGPRI